MQRRDLSLLFFFPEIKEKALFLHVRSRLGGYQTQNKLVFPLPLQWTKRIANEAACKGLTSKISQLDQ